MRVISGKFKCREIPFDNEKFDDANATPQKVKKAMFSMLGEDLEREIFSRPLFMLRPDGY